VTILLSPAGGGKTRRLVQLLVGEAGSIAPRWAVLPDRAQVAAFRRRIAAAGGALGVSVGTFGDLFQEVLARAGRPVALMAEPARQRLLRLALRELEAEGRLPFYQPIARTPGFLEVIGEAIAELKRARVRPEAVEAWAGEIAEKAGTGEASSPNSAGEGRATGADRPTGDGHAPADDRSAGLAELARIYREYEARLAAIPWTDREGLNELGIAALEGQPGLLADMPLIAVDGFDSFEPAQLEALAALSRQVGRLVVALPGTPAMERAAHRRFGRPLARLLEALPSASVDELRPAAVPPEQPQVGRQAPPGPAAEAVGPANEPLRSLESSLFEREATPFDPQGAVEMIEARSPIDEAREALRWVKARLVRDGLAPEDCAVILPDPARYAPLLRRAAAEFGVPLRFIHGETLIQAPAISALLDLLEISRANWPRRLTLQTVRSPYFDLAAWGLGPADALPLDAASQAGQVVEGLDQWEEALTRLVQAQPADADATDEELPRFAPPVGEAAARLLTGLQALAGRLSPARPRSPSGWVEWLEDLLDELGFPERAAAEPERAPEAFERLREALRALVLGEMVAGAQGLTYDEFLDELRGAVEAASYRDRLSAGPAVSAVGLLDARGGRCAAVVVMGLSEGLLPQVEREDPLLDERTRSALGLDPRLGREQAGLFYQAVTRADQKLLLTRPYLAEDGESWVASPFWSAVERILTEPPRRVRPESPRPLAEAGSAEELLFWGVRRGSMPARLLEPHRQRWAELQHGREVLAARGAPEPAGAFEGSLAGLADELSRRYGPDHRWSPSRLETYASCPHMFFAASLLELEAREPPEPGLDAAQLGSVLHEILEAAYRTAEDPRSAESVLQALERVRDPILDRAPQRHGFRPTPLWAIERAQYSAALGDTVRALAELGEDWTPIGLELAFGSGDQPPLELELDGGTVRLHGIVDRLDRRPDGGLRVIDYKTGRSRLGAVELDQGRRVQLPLYALAAQEALRLGPVVEGFYWAILAAEPGPLRLSRYRAPEEDGSASDADPGPERAGGGSARSTGTPAAGGSAAGHRASGGPAPRTGPAAAFATARRHVARVVRGVSAGEFAPIPPPGGCPDYCPATAWCWRYQPSVR
jgi:ATP-dependent helicase/DNAse subunit B